MQTNNIGNQMKSPTVKILAVGDLHIKASQLDEYNKMLVAIKQKCIEVEPDVVVFLGDTLHWHEKIEMRAQCLANSFFRDISQIVEKVFLLIGNHDRENPTDFLSNIHPFTAIDFIKVIHTTHMENVNGYNLCFVPYVQPGRFIEALNKVDNWEESRLIFAHQEFYNTKLGAIKSVEGDRWSLDYPLVISGHIHDYHWLQQNIVYVGTPFSHSYGEKSRKTISLFNLGDSFSEIRLDLALKKKTTIKLKCKDVDNYKPPDNSLVRIVVEDTPENIKILKKKDKTIQGVDKVSFSYLHEKHEYLPNGKFLDLLYKSVKDDKIELKYYKKLFTS